jgi:hypothetical protein
LTSPSTAGTKTRRGRRHPGGYDLPGQPTAERAVISIELLTAPPGNVRRDIHLDQEFVDSPEVALDASH